MDLKILNESELFMLYSGTVGYISFNVDYNHLVKLQWAVSAFRTDMNKL